MRYRKVFVQEAIPVNRPGRMEQAVMIHEQMARDAIRSEQEFNKFRQKYKDFDKFVMDYFSGGIVDVYCSDVAYCIMFVHCLNFYSQCGPSLGCEVIDVARVMRQVVRDDLADADNSGEPADAMVEEIQKDPSFQDVDLMMRVRRKLCDAEDWIYDYNVLMGHTHHNRPRSVHDKPFWCK